MTRWLNLKPILSAYVKDDMRATTCTIASRATPKDVVVVLDAISSYVFDSYYPRCGGRAQRKIIPPAAGASEVKIATMRIE